MKCSLLTRGGAALLLLFSLSFAGCGGGGGGSSALPIVPIPPAPDPVPTSMTIDITVEGALVRPNAEGDYEIQSGDRVELIPSEPANWKSSSSTTGAVELENPEFSNNLKWAANVGNMTEGTVDYTITATAIDDSARSLSVRLQVAPKPAS